MKCTMALQKLNKVPNTFYFGPELIQSMMMLLKDEKFLRNIKEVM